LGASGRELYEPQRFLLYLGSALTAVGEVERRPLEPPALVSFLPAFWLLVPACSVSSGSPEYLGTDPVAGIKDFLGAVGSMVAIGLGVLCGYRCTAPWHSHWAGCRSSDPAEADPDSSSIPLEFDVADAFLGPGDGEEHG
jgi:hypothetical protein